MNGNRHMQYRRRVYRKRRIRMILILSGILILLLAVGFLVLGTVLSNRTDPPADSESEETELSASPTPTAPSVKARATLLETADASTLRVRMQALRQAGATGASVPLNRPDGSLLYRSDIAVALGYDAADYSITVGNAAKQAEDQELRLCGVWYLTALAEENDLLRSVRLSESAAILADALRNGLDDVLLIAPTRSEQWLDELTVFAEELRRLCPDGTIGFCLPNTLSEDEDASVTVDDLVHTFDFLAVDATAYAEGTLPETHAESVASSHLDDLLRYRMRLLLPELADPASQEKVIAVAEQYYAKSWQILPVTP